MHYGKVLHVSQLKVGDVVRPLRGAQVQVPGAPALPLTEEDALKPDGCQRKILSTWGWRHPPIGGPDDFRSAYDAMTVVHTDEHYVDFMRPYLHVTTSGVLSAVGMEKVGNVWREGGHWYELLS